MELPTTMTCLCLNYEGNILLYTLLTLLIPSYIYFFICGFFPSLRVFVPDNSVGPIIKSQQKCCPFDPKSLN